MSAVHAGLYIDRAVNSKGSFTRCDLMCMWLRLLMQFCETVHMVRLRFISFVWIAHCNHSEWVWNPFICKTTHKCICNYHSHTIQAVLLTSTQNIFIAVTFVCVTSHMNGLHTHSVRLHSSRIHKKTPCVQALTQCCSVSNITGLSTFLLIEGSLSV